MDPRKRARSRRNRKRHLNSRVSKPISMCKQCDNLSISTCKQCGNFIMYGLLHYMHHGNILVTSINLNVDMLLFLKFKIEAQ
jgi:hypothetical protein